MSDSEHSEEPTEQEHPAEESVEDESTTAPSEAVVDDEESTGDPLLDKLLSEGVLKGMARMGLAQTLLAAFIVMSMGWFAYSATLSIPFLIAEEELIVEQESLHRIPTISAAWGEAVSPTAAFLHALNWGMADGRAVPFRVTQLFLHMLNAMLVYVLCRRLVNGEETEAIALTGGVLFAVHPITTFAVTPLTEQSVVVATFFTLLSFVLFLHSQQDDETNLTTYVLSLMAFGMAWSNGHWTWVLPLLVMALAIVDTGLKGLRTKAMYWGGFILVGALLIGHRLVLSEYALPGLNIQGLWNEADHTLMVITGWVMPGSLPLVVAEPTATAGVSIPFIGMLVVGIGLLLRWPRLAWGIVCPLLVLAGFGLAGVDSGFEMAHLYPISIGIACLVPVILSMAPQGKIRNGIGVIVAVGVMVSLMLTHLRTTDWKDEEYFWTMAQGDCTECYEPNMRLATLYKELGDDAISTAEGTQPTSSQTESAKRHWSQAESFYRIALGTAPDATMLQSPLADVLAGQGKYDEAIDAMEQWLGVHTDDALATRKLSIWYAQRFVQSKQPQDIQHSTNLYIRLESLGALTENDHLQWGVLLYQLGDFPNAARQLQAIKNAELRKQVAGLIEQLNPRITKLNEITQQLQSSAAQSMTRVEVLRIRTQQLLAEGKIQTATYYAEEVLRSSGETWTAEDWYRLGHVYGLQGAWETFVAKWPAPSSFSTPWQFLAEYCVKEKNWNTALQALVRRPLILGGDPNAEAVLTLTDMAIAAKEYQRASMLLQGMMQQFPQRVEPWLKMAEIAIATKQEELIRTCLREAQARGASEEVLAELRKRAQIEETVTDTMAPTIIQ